MSNSCAGLYSEVQSRLAALSRRSFHQVNMEIDDDVVVQDDDVQMSTAQDDLVVQEAPSQPFEFVEMVYVQGDNSCMAYALSFVAFMYNAGTEITTRNAPQILFCLRVPAEQYYERMARKYGGGSPHLAFHDFIPNHEFNFVQFRARMLAIDDERYAFPRLDEEGSMNRYFDLNLAQHLPPEPQLHPLRQQWKRHNPECERSNILQHRSSCQLHARSHSTSENHRQNQLCRSVFDPPNTLRI